MRRKLAGAAGALVAILVMPAAASAGTVGILAQKACYRAGEQVLMGGGGYTPNGGVQLNLNGRAVPGSPLGTDPGGNFAAIVTIGEPHGERLNTYTAVDLNNTANQGTRQLRATSVAVRLPKRGTPGNVIRIKARGFTTGKTLYIHVKRGRKVINHKLGRLHGACRKLSIRRRLFSRRTRVGTYTVQFDTKRHYSKKTAVRVVVPGGVTIFRTVSGALAARTN